MACVQSGHAHLRADPWPLLLLLLRPLCCSAASNAVFSSSAAACGGTDGGMQLSAGCPGAVRVSGRQATATSAAALAAAAHNANVALRDGMAFVTTGAMGHS